MSRKDIKSLRLNDLNRNDVFETVIADVIARRAIENKIRRDLQKCGMTSREAHESSGLSLIRLFRRFLDLNEHVHLTSKQYYDILDSCDGQIDDTFDYEKELTENE